MMDRIQELQAAERRYETLKAFLLEHGIIQFVALPTSDSVPFAMLGDTPVVFYGPSIEAVLDEIGK